MASQEPPEESQQGDGKQPLSPAKRKRLQQCFEHANLQMSQGNYDYATELFTQCVAGDPANLIYLQSFLANLKKKYNDNKKGSKLALIQLPRARSGVKKATAHEDWLGVIKAGLEALKLNPWDVSTLSQMADASNAMGNHDVQLACLKTALEANPKDPHVNRLCAEALRELGQFDQAMACWHRVEQAKPGDEEAGRQIASLAVEKTIAKGGYEDPDRRSTALEAEKQQPKREEVVELTAEQRLEREIARNPKDASKYVELAELHMTRERYERAEQMFAKALEISAEDDDIRERWEDAQLRHLRQNLVKAESEAKQSDSQEAKKRFQQLKQELNAKELEVHQNRVKRYPNNLTFRYDLGVRYQMNGRYNEAISEYQQARNDPRRKGVCMLALGQCFQQIKQYRLAMSHYESAIQEIPDRDASNKKLALYLAGRLATAMKDYEVGERHLTTLAGMDFSYRDVSKLLDKIAELRESGAEEEKTEDQQPEEE
jgi:tetratricopeptide (TPR) repeat protein